MGFNIERTNKPFVVKSPYKPRGDQLKRLKSLRNALKTVRTMWSHGRYRNWQNCHHGMAY